jgi:hypothetical protein
MQHKNVIITMNWDSGSLVLSALVAHRLNLCDRRGLKCARFPSKVVIREGLPLTLLVSVP